MSYADCVDLSAVRQLVGQCAFRRSASLLLLEASRKESFRTRRRFGRFAFTCFVAWQNSGAEDASRERICFSPLPGGERSTSEGTRVRRSQLARSVPPHPPPPDQVGGRLPLPNGARGKGSFARTRLFHISPNGERERKERMRK